MIYYSLFSIIFEYLNIFHKIILLVLYNSDKVKEGRKWWNFLNNNFAIIRFFFRFIWKQAAWLSKREWITTCAWRSFATAPAATFQVFNQLRMADNHCQIQVRFWCSCLVSRTSQLWGTRSRARAQRMTGTASSPSSSCSTPRWTLSSSMVSSRNSITISAKSWAILSIQALLEHT